MQSIHLKGLLVEIGVGSGVVLDAILNQAPGTDIIGMGVDINAEALQHAHRFVVDKRTDFVLGDLLQFFRRDLIVDFIVCNPPYVPSDPLDKMDNAAPVDFAWAGGVAGREVIDRLLNECSALICPGGSIYLLVIEANNPTDVMELGIRNGLKPKIIHRRKTVLEHQYVIKFIKC